MKKIISGNELRIKMKEAIDLLCNTVSSTLGPKGNNVIIDHSNFSPFITNDGVTIAQNIESDDEVINTILEIAKEASIKTDLDVGDGTTTTLVLLQKIFNEGLKYIDEGMNPLILKRELDKTVNLIVEDIKKESKLPNNNDLLRIATTSANDKEIGKIITDAFIKTKNKNTINIIESDNEETSLNFINGYTFSTEIASPYFFKDKNELIFNNAKIVIIDDELNELNELGFVLNEVINKKYDLIVMANDYNKDVINDVIALNMDLENKIILLKIPEYGIIQNHILKDISAITDSFIIEKDIPLLNDMGNIETIKISDETTIISFNKNEKIDKRVKELEKLIKNSKSDIEKDFLNKSLSMFNTCLATINVGAKTITERREKKMRYIDALSSIENSKKGIVPGGGIILLKIADNINLSDIPYKILKEALCTPIKQILINSGNNFEEVIQNIQKENYTNIFNSLSSTYEDIKNTTILDSTLVVINALKNACSIAGMLLTTSSLIINEYKNNSNNNYNFNEL